MKPIFSVHDEKGYLIVKFEIPGGVCTPEEFASAVEEIRNRVAGDKPVLLNGRGPVWGYGMLIHASHPSTAIGTFDPRLAGYVIVASHDTKYAVGQVIPDPE